jgi:hypothetical protein
MPPIFTKCYFCSFRIAARRVSTLLSRSLSSLGSPGSLDFLSYIRRASLLKRQLVTTVLHELILSKALVTCGTRRWLYFQLKVLFSLSQMGRYNSILSRSTSLHWRWCCFAYTISIDPSGYNNCTAREDFAFTQLFLDPDNLSFETFLCLPSVL